MSSKNIYTPEFISNQYCVYHTIYSGDLLPANYIGSSYVDRIINKEYHGSVLSKKYKNIWENELKLYPDLFNTIIISYHDTKPEALYKELQIQRIFNVVKNNLFINMAYATVNGFCGRDNSGANNPAYNRIYKTSKSTKLLHKQVHLNNPRIWVKLGSISEFIPKTKLEDYLNNNWVLGRIINRQNKTTKQTYCCCVCCKKQIQVNNLTNHIKGHDKNNNPYNITKLEYFGEIFYGYKNLLIYGKCTKHSYIKYYLNGIDPRPFLKS